MEWRSQSFELHSGYFWGNGGRVGSFNEYAFNLEKFVLLNNGHLVSKEASTKILGLVDPVFGEGVFSWSENALFSNHLLFDI